MEGLKKEQSGYNYLLSLDANYMHHGMVRKPNGCLIHPSVKLSGTALLGAGVIIEENCEIGEDCIIANYVVMRPNVKLGAGCKIGHHTVFEGDTTVGNYVTIQSLSEVCRFSVIEDHVYIGPHFSSADENLIANSIRRGRPAFRDFKQIGQHIKRGARLGNAIDILPGVTIGENAFVGVGSLVTKDIPPAVLVVGRPAKKVRDVPKDEWV